MSKNHKEKTRRSFLTFGKSKTAQDSSGQSFEEKDTDKEMIKMLTPDGRLVEIRRSVADNSQNKKKASNRDILLWAQNKPSQTK